MKGPENTKSQYQISKVLAFCSLIFTLPQEYIAVIINFCLHNLDICQNIHPSQIDIFTGKYQICSRIESDTLGKAWFCVAW